MATLSSSSLPAGKASTPPRSRSPPCDRKVTGVPAAPAEFWDEAFLAEHANSVLQFYSTAGVLDEVAGGFHQNFKDDGAKFNAGFKQLVSSTRMVVNYALGAVTLGRPELLDLARHGLAFVEKTHWRAETREYAFTVRDGEPEDMTQQAYGYAFVMLMYAACLRAKLVPDERMLMHTYELLEERFWQPEHGLYADELSAAPAGVLSAYRGQNANMHLCEALIAAYEASGNARFLQRALVLAKNVTVRQAGLAANALVWEHFTSDFEVDWEYNRDDPKNLYRPWGFQPGHQAEWAKNLLNLQRHLGDPKERPWLLRRARELFDAAWGLAWDEEHGGLVYGFDAEGRWCDDEKYFWVQAESFATAALLWSATGEDKYREAYDALWGYAWRHFVDHEYGAWFRILRRDNSKITDEKSAAGAKCDYHVLNSVYEVLRVLRDGDYSPK